MFEKNSLLGHPIIYLFLLSLLITTTASADWLTPSAEDPDNPNADIWQIIGSQIILDNDVNRPEVQKQIQNYTKDPKQLQRITARSTPYLYYIYEQIRLKKLPAAISLIPIIESAYNPMLYSQAGASGLWQLMPGTGTGYGVEQNEWYDGRRDIIVSTDAALNYLAYLNKYFQGKFYLALAAYHSGEGTVSNAVKKNELAHKSTSFWDLNLPRDTQTYIPKFIALAAIVKNPKKYGVELSYVANQPYLTPVKVDSQITLSLAAQMIDIDVEAFHGLNPGYNQWTTSPDSAHTLLVPLEKAEIFKQKLKNQSKHRSTTWTRYTVKAGDTLSQIAQSHNTKTALIKKSNQLKNNTIKVGQILFIPKNAKSLNAAELKSKKFTPKIKQPKVGPRKVSYKVKQGDTLWKIADAHHVKTSEIRFWNQLAYNHNVQKGEELIIWEPRSKKKTKLLYKMQPTSYRHHTVVAGDTLKAIAKTYQSSVMGIQKENKLSNSLIVPGKKLIIPIYDKSQYMQFYTVVSGDTLGHIAQKFNSNSRELMKINDFNTTVIKPGQKILVPRVQKKAETT